MLVVEPFGTCLFNNKVSMFTPSGPAFRSLNTNIEAMLAFRMASDQPAGDSVASVVWFDKVNVTSLTIADSSVVRDSTLVAYFVVLSSRNGIPEAKDFPL